VGGSGELALMGVAEGVYHYGGVQDLRPMNGEKIQDGDQIAIWFEGIDLSGNSLVGEGTEGDERVPLLEIIEFVPTLSGFTISPMVPEYGDSVQIQVKFTNQGQRAGSINLTLVERIDDVWHIHDSKTINLTSLDSDGRTVFEWEAWKSGPAELYIYIDDDSDVRIPVDEFSVKGEEKPQGAATTTVLLIAVVAVLGTIVVGLLGVIVLRKPSESMDEYVDAWVDDEDSFGSKSNIRLDYEEDTLWNAVSRHGIYDKDAFLAHALVYDRDGDGFLDADELDRAAIDFTSLMTKPTVTFESEYPLDFNDETVSHIIESNEIQDKAAFLHFANAYDLDQNGYLKHSELNRAAADFIKSGRNIEPQVKSTPDPRLLAVAEVRSAIPNWSEEKINSWMDSGWSAKQIIDNHGTPTPPLAPAGFGDDFEPPVEERKPEPVVESVPEPEPVVEMERKTESVEAPAIETQPEPEPEPGPNATSLKRLKKAELVELATIQGLDSSGTKADIIARLIG
jgi:hypothetical protein